MVTITFNFWSAFFGFFIGFCFGCYVASNKDDNNKKCG